MKINEVIGSQKPKKPSEENSFSGNTWTVTLPKTRIHTLDELIEYCKVDLAVWEVERFICNKWEVGAKNSDGDLVVEPLFQVKAFLKRRTVVEAILNEINELKKLAEEYPWPQSILKDSPRKVSGRMLEGVKVVAPD